VDLRERLEGYEVTLVPRRSALRLVWSVPDATELQRVDDGDALAGPSGSQSAHADTLAILADYRITRIPLCRAAS
jgi:hypothetical protein